MIAKIYDGSENFIGVYEIESLHREDVGGFPVWVFESKTSKMTLREGDRAYISTITGKHLKTVTQQHLGGV